MSDKAGEALAICRDFWGVSGRDQTLRTDDLRKLKLSASDAERVLDGLPMSTGAGTTAQRVRACQLMMERIAGRA